MTHAPETDLSALVGKVYIINLESRPDRRREMLAELARIDLQEGDPLVRFFKAVKPDAPGTFPSIGARGCFLSHLGILQTARADGHRAILILEDDAALTPECRQDLAAVLAELETTDWALAYLGHRIAPEKIPGPDHARTTHWHELPPGTGIETTHAMVIHQRAFDPLVQYLERMMARPAGDPKGGPMHVDGAYSWFRREHPDLLTLITPQQYVLQRASKSDIAPPSWKDKLPFMGMLRALRNRLS